MAKIKVLFVTAEVTPLIKTGGLADVSASLPVALRGLGVDVRLLLPGYKTVMDQCSSFKNVTKFSSPAGFPSARLLSGRLNNGTPLYLLDCPELYQREGTPYQDTQGNDWSDNVMRFGMFSKVAALLGSSASPLIWRPNLVHCNDWQSGLTPAYLHFTEEGAVPSLMTLHNLSFQGIFPSSYVQQLGLPSASFHMEGLEYYGSLSFLKAGLYYATHLTTVSPSYAKEIQTDALGFGMQGLLRTRQHNLTGILNGIDLDEWNPATDPYLTHHYSSARLKGKAMNKQGLQQSMGLPIDPEVPLLGVVSRFTQQKGLDVLLEIVPRLMELPVQLVMLGSGEAGMVEAAQDLARRYPRKVALRVGPNEVDLSHQIEAGADMFIMPSRFEPCGLNQMYSQRYGTPPIVHATGGLSDSVVDCTPQTLADGLATGFMFTEMSSNHLFDAIQRAVTLYGHKKSWQALCKIAMAQDFSWETSAQAYLRVYQQLVS
jgi:starch synthase